MHAATLSIGAIAARSGTSVPTIRYYEEIGLLPAPRRTASGHRHYREDDLQRLVFVKRCRDFGFAIEQVRALVRLFEEGDRACVEARDLAQRHLDEVRAKLDDMRALEASLAAFVDSCNAECCSGPARDCTIIGGLSVPAAPESAGARITEARRR